MSRSCFLALTMAALAAITMPARAAHDEIPGAPQSQPIALIGGTIHPVSGPPIENGTLVFDNGVITAIGVDVEIPDNARRVELEGKHVYPSMFESHSQIGLVEISAVRATVDTNETGSFNPNVHAAVAVNPDSEVIPVTRSNGVLLALSAPSGGIISGRSTVLQLDGWTYEDLTLLGNAAMQINWPRMTPFVSFRTPQSPSEQREQRDLALQSLRDFFDGVLAYRQARAADPEGQPFDTVLDAMLPVVNGEMPVMIEANDSLQIQSAIAFCVDYGLKPIILGGYDAPLCAALLRRHDVPVIVSAVHRRPRSRDDAYDAPYTLPERLREAGIRFCISGSDRSETSNVRNLPYQAGMAVAFGLPHDEALRSVTLYPAQILGVADRVGSLEVGKDATLFIADGDPLETATQILEAYIQGRQVSLSNRHTRLYEKYREKYRRQRDADPG